MNLEVDSDNVQKLLDSHNQELTIDELIELHKQEQDIEEPYVLVADAYSEDNEVSLKSAVVAVASQSKNTQFVTFRIHEVKIHPKFEIIAERPVYDIALLKLKDTIIFSDRVRPICLSMKPFFEKPGGAAMVIGWGAMNKEGLMHENLSWFNCHTNERTLGLNRLNAHRSSLHSRSSVTPGLEPATHKPCVYGHNHYATEATLSSEIECLSIISL
ncbi:peptidase S1 domain-containing protein [Trichonephila clavipes]|nr:peptidase S1 domain-containing protein [Trichonephila clavipes]